MVRRRSLVSAMMSGQRVCDAVVEYGFDRRLRVVGNGEACGCDTIYHFWCWGEGLS